MTLHMPFSPDLAARTSLVFLAAGRGQRFGGVEVSKHLAEVQGVPLLVRLVKQLASAVPTTPIVVVRAGDTSTPSVLKTWGVEARVVRQVCGEGTVAAILDALPYCAEYVCVVLGDLVMEGRFLDLVIQQPAIGVWPGGPERAVQANFGVELDGSTVVRVVEKPVEPVDLACGMGVYVLGAELIRSYSDKVPTDQRGERGVTDLLAAMVADGITLSAVTFQGLYINVNQRADLVEAQRGLLRN